MPSIQEKVAQAKQAGYSDDEITSYLSTLPDYSDKVKAASQAGYKPSEIVSFFSSIKQPSEKMSAQKTDALKGTHIGETLESIDRVAEDLKKQGPVGTLKAAAGIPLGAAETVGTLLSGFGASAYGGLKGLGTTAYEMMRGKSFDQATEEAAKASQAAQQAYTYEPRTTSGKVLGASVAAPFMLAKDVAGAVGGGVGQLIGGDKGRLVGESLGDIAPDVAATLLGRAPANRGAVRAAEVAKKAPGAVADALVPNMSPEMLDLALKAKEAGIPIRPDQIAQNPTLKMLGKYAEDVPAASSGQPARQIAVNRAIGREIGADPNATGITSKVFDDALKQSGERIGYYAERNPIDIKLGLKDELESVVQLAKDKYPTAKKVAKSYVNDVLESANENGGVIDGTAFRNLSSAIAERAKTVTDGDIEFILNKVQEKMQDALEKRLTGDELADLKNARYQYAIGKLLTPLVAKAGPEGNISPVALLQRITSNEFGKDLKARGKAGPIGDIADIGQQFLKEEKSSGTAERYFTLGGAGALGSSLLTGNPLPALGAAGAWGAAKAYNKMSPAIAERMVSRLSERVATQNAMKQEAINAQNAQVGVGSKLQERIQRGRQQKLEDIGSAKSVDDAIKAAGD